MCKKIYFLFIFIIFILLFSSVHSYSIVDSNTHILLKKNNTSKVTTHLKVKDLNSNNLSLSFLPVYDSKVYINQKEVKNIIFNSVNLYIPIENINEKQDLSLDIIYLTDYFITKDVNHWNFNYFNPFLEHINDKQIIFQSNINDFTLISNLNNTDSLFTKNNKLTICFKDLNSFSFTYKINNNEKIGKGNFNYVNFLYFIIILIIIFIIYFIISKKINKKRNIKRLLKGLNKNEEKIIKVLLKEDNILQKSISTKTNLPNGTISRNLKKLENKDYIKIVAYGRTNKIFLGSIFKK